MRSFVLIIILAIGATASSHTLLPVSSTPATNRISTMLSTENDMQKEGGIQSNLEAQITGKPAEVLDAISFSKIFWTIVLIGIAFILIKFLVKFFELLAERSTKLRISLKSLIPIVRIGIWSIVIYAIIKGIYSPPIETVLALTASVGIAVGFAAQDMLKNVFGGIMLLFDKPFQVGDKIEAGKYYGEVLEIGLRATRIVTPDDSVVSIPNMELMNSAVSNTNYGELNCQVVAEIYLPLYIDTQAVRKIAIEAAQVSRFVFLNKPIVAEFIHVVVGPKAHLKMRLKAYVMDIRYEFHFQSDMTEIVIKELLQQEIVKGE